MMDFLKYVKTPKWFLLGLNLGISETDMRMIKSDARDASDALQRICEAYLEGADNPRWRDVVDAFYAIGDKAQARKLEERFC